MRAGVCGCVCAHVFGVVKVAVMCLTCLWGSTSGGPALQVGRLQACLGDALPAGMAGALQNGPYA